MAGSSLGVRAASRRTVLAAATVTGAAWLAACAPLGTIGCVHRVARIDDLRERPAETLQTWFGTGESADALPAPIQRYTNYAAGVVAASAHRGIATDLIAFLGTPAAVKVMRSNGCPNASV